MPRTKEEIKEEGGKCEKVATDFWECTDSGGKVWWCQSSGDCVEKPTSSIGTKQITIDDMISNGARCAQVRDDLLICRGKDGTVWACNLQTGGCTAIIPREAPREKGGCGCDEAKESVQDNSRYAPWDFDANPGLAREEPPFPPVSGFSRQLVGSQEMPQAEGTLGAWGCFPSTCGCSQWTWDHWAERWVCLRRKKCTRCIWPW